jgi:hypothetical protein
LALTENQNWRVLCCQLFERELFIGNIFGGFEKAGEMTVLAVFLKLSMQL